MESKRNSKDSPRCHHSRIQRREKDRFSTSHVKLHLRAETAPAQVATQPLRVCIHDADFDGVTNQENYKQIITRFHA